MTSLSDALKAVSLKPVEIESDKSGPKLGGFLTDEAISSYQNAVLDVNMEKWLDVLADLSFPTVFCPLTLQEANTFIKIFETLYKNVDSQNIAGIDWRDGIDSDSMAIVKNMANKLEVSMKEFLGDEYGFVKTSSRSAKDAPLVQERFKALYLTELQKFSAEERGCENTQLICLLTAAFESLKVANSWEVIDMFVRSERIYQDMLLATSCQERFHEHFVIRKFVHIDVHMEFRGFVYEGQLTALSQYNYLIYSEDLVANKDSLCEKIKRFFGKQVQPRMEANSFLKNYVIDFAICDDKVWVIEINPFLETTDGALFDWNKELDILQGTREFVFRLTEKPKPGSKVMLPRGARELLKLA